MKLHRFLPFAGLALLLAGSAWADDQVDFNRDIRPILSNTCYACHGPDENERQAGLRFDTQEGALAELDSGGRAVVPGQPEESTLFQRITSDDPDERMPPAHSGKALQPEQIELVRRWIEQGAPWRGHWSLLPPERPAPPQVAHESHVRNEIDRFILARVEKENLSPSPEADKVALIRRATYDLTGLPPTAAEIDDFLADDSDNAYEKLVDRLLNSPRYGEHMARYWLDAARYGDTHGLHLDNERSLWKYRDWVIAAFNRNQPFDRFTIEQLAGDLLPEPTLEQRVATGFNRCNVTTSEGGSINEEVLVRYAVDRVETTSTVWLGLTAGCAACHDHKFDPISQREFYQLYAFFGSTADAAMDGNALSPPPILKLPTPEQTEALEKLEPEIARLQKAVADELAKVEYVEPGDAPEQPASEPQDYVWIDDDLPAGAQPSTENGGWQWVAAPEHPVYSGQKSTRRSAAGLTQHYFTGATAGLRIGEGDKLFAYVYIDPVELPKAIMLQFNDGTWEHRAVWGEDVIPWGMPDTASRVHAGPLPELGEWVRLEVEAEKVGLKPGAVLNGWAFTQHDGTVYWDKAGLVTRTAQDKQEFDSLRAWEVFAKSQNYKDIPQPVQNILKLESDKRNEDQQRQVKNYFIEHVYSRTRETFAPLHQQLAELNKQKADTDGAIATTLVMAEMPQPRDTHVLIRGAYDKKGEKVTAGVPAALPPLPEGAPLNRLGLAQWIVDPANPLTARVTVNRLWQHFFGRGIVKTSEDFGAQGEWPTHPELLDWLATDFVDSGWDVKGFVKKLMMSGTYRQSSHVSPELIERDPENILLARGPRFRLDAEVIRDTALAVSGLLVEQVGGKSVKPYQPPGLWEAVGFVGSNTSKFSRDDGQALYRRSLYTFWKRTSPPPSLLTFDAPSRETCTVRRSRTNTPLQALVLMNDEQYVEAARQFAERMLMEGGDSPSDRLRFAFRLATGRMPSESELGVLTRLLDAQLEEYRGDQEAATKLIGVGEAKRNESLEASELAAYTMVGNLILNLDETVTKQ